MKKILTNKLFSRIKKSILIYILFSILIIASLNSKKNYHIDEIFSYGLSNYIQGINPVFEDGRVYEPASSVFDDYMIVHSNNRFNYINVWKNQSLDVHPPLYYVLLHTICSFFPDTFSIWYAGIINIVFALIMLYYFRSIIELLVPHNIFFKNYASLCFIFTAGILSANTFLRMYIMAMAFCIMFTFILLKHFNKSLTFKDWFVFSIAFILGALTHYYCIIYDIIVEIIYILLIQNDKKKDLIKSILLATIISGFISMLIFPPVFKHIFMSSRGRQTLKNILAFNIKDFLYRMYDFACLISNELFGGLLLVIIFVFLMIIKILRNRTSTDRKYRSIFFLGLSTLIYYITISKLAVFIEDRYMYIIYPIVYISFMVVLENVARSALPKIGYYIIIVGLGVIIVCGSWKNTYWNYTYWYPYDYTVKDLIIDSNNIPAFCIYNDSWETQYLYEDFKEVKNIMFISQDRIDDYIKFFPEKAIFFISPYLTNENVLKDLENNYNNFNNCLVNSSERGYVYYIDNSD